MKRTKWEMMKLGEGWDQVLCSTHGQAARVLSHLTARSSREEGASVFFFSFFPHFASAMYCSPFLVSPGGLVRNSSPRTALLNTGASSSGPVRRIVCSWLLRQCLHSSPSSTYVEGNQPTLPLTSPLHQPLAPVLV